MKLKFEYNKQKDIWCLINKGKTSNNSPTPTKVYSELVATFGENPNENLTSLFIDSYLKKVNDYNLSELLEKYQQEFENISSEYTKIAEKIFGISLNAEITAYLTINNRCPYNINESWFFVGIGNSKYSPKRNIMHELWHFYTWHKFGINEEQKIGEKKYNDIKEALTVLLNVECRHLLPEGDEDKGYPQHQELRKKILELWAQNPDINYVWKEALNFTD